MNRSVSMSFALMTLAAALLAWGVVGYGIYFVYTERGRVEAAVEIAAQAHIKGMTAGRVHGQLRESKGARQELESLLARDIVALLDVIETAGKRAGVAFEIGAATPVEGIQEPLQAVSVAVSAEGSFEKLAQAASYIESLPGPILLQSLELVRTSDSGSKIPWRLSARLNLYTTSSSL